MRQAVSDSRRVPARRRAGSLAASARIWVIRLAFRLATLFPLRRRVVLATAHSDSIDGNLERIRAELQRRWPQEHVVVLAFRSRAGLRGAASVAFNSMHAAFLLATSRVFIVDDYFFPIYVIRPRAGTRIIQVWHACGAFKKFGHSVADKSFGADAALTSRVRIHSNYDVCLASSEAAAVCYAEAFQQPLERFEWSLGIPKTDLLFGQNAAQEAERVRGEHGITSGRRVVLYAPTFRGERAYDARYPDLLEMAALDDLIGDDHVILLRLHPYVRARPSSATARTGFVVDVSDYPDVTELMAASDVLVTDYSSLIFDFSLLDRPIVFFAPDHAAYERERGFYFDYRSDGPGPVFETSHELGEYLRRGAFDVERVKRFRRRWFTVADGRATERVVERLVLPALDAHDGTTPAPREPAS